MKDDYLVVRNVSKRYISRKQVYNALKRISLRIGAGEFVSLIGPSGCGKTTLLNLIAGLEACDGGEILLEGKKIEGPGKERGVVFQNHALFPWMTVLENIMFALNCVRKDDSCQQKEEWALHCLEMVQLGAARDKKPGELSGGMKQRVGIARAFAVNPKVLLLDEPFGALDALTRECLQGELERIWQENRRTVILVTHDVDEAILLSDRIVVMSRGPDAQIIADMPVELPRPRSRNELVQFPRYREIREKTLQLLAVTPG